MRRRPDAPELVEESPMNQPTAQQTTGDPGNRVVAIESGLISGKSGDVSSFFGIPYAAPPTGDLRWRPPQPPASWPGVRPAHEFGADAPQATSAKSRAGRMDEDCLTLNIWTAAKAAGEKRPVMVWLYGGSYVSGSASDPRCDGESFARKGAVLVTINYRVGVLGFMAHPGLTQESEHKSSGNYGLLDVLAALAWVRRNIAAFGGDPERVTLFGVSAGAASISLLLTSSLSRGLFQQTIQQSPGAFRPLASLAEAETAGLQLGPDIAAIRRMSSEEILSKTPMFVPKQRGLTTPRVLRPIRDGWIIPSDERAAYAAGDILPVPSIVGGNADEGSKLTAAWQITSADALNKLIDESFGRSAAQAREHYVGDGRQSPREVVAAMFGDTQFNDGARGMTRGLTAKGVPVYRYLLLRQRPGCGPPNHGEDVPYVFASLAAAAQLDPAPFDAADERLAEAIQDAWVRFATTGDPNGGALPHWPVNDGSERYLELDDPIRVGQGWRKPQLDFLDAYFLEQATSKT
jgi:para-nitrobenzyl esterase